MKDKLFTLEFASKFKKPYQYKMGGTQTVVMPNGQRFEFNNKETYSGRGAKYNASIKYHYIGDVIVTKAQVKEAFKIIKDFEKAIKLRLKEQKAKDKRIKQAIKSGVYSLMPSYCGNGHTVELSDNEVYGKFFDSKRLAKTFNISVEDANLLNSHGKTYVFAKTADGRVLEMYHASLDCNNLSIWVAEATPERIAEFQPKEWQSAPFANLVGQSLNNNHFVC